MVSTRTLIGGALSLALAGTFVINGGAAETADTPAYSQALADINASLAASHAGYRIDSAELLVNINGAQRATTLVANNRTHKVDSLFVARDPRRDGRSNITYLVDQSDGRAFAVRADGATVDVLANAATEPVIDRAMLRWQNSPSCPGPAVAKVADDGSNVDLVDDIVFGRPQGTSKADITHAGWLAAAFFDAIADQGSTFILGVTFTAVFTEDDELTATDIDHDGRADTAFREIYYNRAFPWTANLATHPATFNIDIDSVVTHEAGHAFGLGHFGKVFVDNKGALKYAPRAVMNAVYASPFAELAGTDNASYCSIWAHRQ